VSFSPYSKKRTHFDSPKRVRNLMFLGIWPDRPVKPPENILKLTNLPMLGLKVPESSKFLRKLSVPVKTVFAVNTGQQMEGEILRLRDKRILVLTQVRQAIQGDRYGTTEVVHS